VIRLLIDLEARRAVSPITPHGITANVHAASRGVRCRRRCDRV